MKTINSLWRSRKFDTIIIILIGVCIVGMIQASNYKIDEIFNSHRESLLVRDNVEDNISDELAAQLLEFRPDSCKMIEMYSKDLDLVLRMQFIDDHIHDDNIKNYPELVEILQTHTEGHTTIRTEDDETDIYFRWEHTVQTETPVLTMVYMSRPIVKNLWVISFLGYLILIMVGILLLRNRLVQSHADIKRYQELSREVQEKLIR